MEISHLEVLEQLNHVGAGAQLWPVLVAFSRLMLGPQAMPIWGQVSPTAEHFVLNADHVCAGTAFVSSMGRRLE